MTDPPERGDLVVKIVTIVTLGVILLASVAGITIVSVMTERNVARAEALTFGGVVLVAALGGVSWSLLLARRRRRRWHIEREELNNGPER